MRMIVTAPKARVYGKVMKAGDEFDCPDKEARVWGALARAKPADGATASQTANETANQLDLGTGDGRRARRRSGSYNRTDMRAED